MVMSLLWSVANVVSYGNMINLYSKFQRLAEAEILQAKMQESGVKPNAYIYGTLVKFLEFAIGDGVN